ncbi:MAG: DUF4922 domain-containing protein [Bacteroidales bacterium]
MGGQLNSHNLTNLFEEQLNYWEQARRNYEALARVKTKELIVDNFPFKVQFNPARIVSSAAKVDARSIQERKCFLCKENRPEVQKGLDYFNNMDNNNPYTVLINPFPIFPKHLTIPLLKHQDQLIAGRFDAMVNLTEQLPQYTLFYNGPKCGASAPDHFHFQAGNRGFLPIEKELSGLRKNIVFKSTNTTLYEITSGINGVLLMESSSKEESISVFNKIYSILDVKEGEKEPMLNILCWFGKGLWTTALYMRSKHRPSHYFAEGEANILLSPAAVDLGGVFITPLEKDFNKISAKDIREILYEVCISFEELHLLVNKIKPIL